MLESMLIAAEQTVILFLLMAFGMLSKKTDLFDEAAIRRLTEFLMQVITPCIILTSFQGPYLPEKIVGLGWSFAAAVLVTIFGIVFSKLAIHSHDERYNRSLKWAVVFSNCGYMGIPLEQAIFGSDGIFYVTAAIATFNIFAWTYGVCLMGGKSSGGFFKALLTSANIAIAVGIVLFFLPWRLPRVLAVPIATIGNLNTPVAMLVMGYYLANAKFLTALTTKSTYLMLLLRHFLLPGLLIAVLSMCPFIDRTVRLCAIIPAAAPVGALLTVFAVRYNGEARFATAVVSVSTILSILTIPLLLGLANTVF